MVDHLSKEKRSKIMSSIRSKDTKPEMVVRSILHRMGYRFRLYRKDLPGKPDIVLPKYKTVIFVNGCFWHRHRGCKYCKTPKSNQIYWESKFQKNVDRDKKNRRLLKKQGWKCIIIWECKTNNPQAIKKLFKELSKNNL